MPIRTLQTFFTVTLITIAFITHVPAQDALESAARPSPPTDYFEYITLFSDGRITRFTQMPIQVYISPVLKETPYLAAIRYAMQEWETATVGGPSRSRLRFEETEVPAHADIRVSWGYSNLMNIMDTRLGSAELTRLGDSTQTDFAQEMEAFNITDEEARNTRKEFKVEVVLMLEGYGTVGELSQEEMRTVCLHEFGHAIGLWGHSPHPGDVSYPTATAQRPTARDINTLRRLYNTPLNTPQHELAINALKTEIERKPKDLRAHYLLGTVYFDRAHLGFSIRPWAPTGTGKLSGDLENAIACFQACRRLDANFQPAIEKLLQAYQETGKTTEAINLLQKRVAQKPSPSDYNTLGIFYYGKKEVEQAMHAFENALALAPYHKAARRNLHQLLREKAFKALAAKDFSTATEAFEKALRINPLDAPTYQLMGSGYAQIGKFEKAIEHYLKAIKINPVDPLTQQNLAQCYNNYGVMLRNREKWDEAIEAYRNALQLMPTLHIARTNLSDAFWQKANTYREAGQIDEAVDTYLALLKLRPNDTHIYSLLGELYLKKADFSYGSASEVSEGPDIQGKISSEASDANSFYSAALSAFQKVYDAEPTAEHALHNLIAAYHHYARSLIQQEHYAESIQLLEEALRLVPKMPSGNFPDYTDARLNLRLSLADAYQNTGNYQRAAAELASVLAQEPHNPQAKSEQINLQIRRGNELMRQRSYAAALAEFEAIPESARDIEIYNIIGYLYLVQGEYLTAFAAFETVLQKDAINMPAYRNLLSLESQLVRRRSAKTKDALLVKVHCTLAICLMHRKQPDAALAKYEQAKNSTSAAHAPLLFDTGTQLVGGFQAQGDIVRTAKVRQWLKELTDDFSHLLDR